MVEVCTNKLPPPSPEPVASSEASQCGMTKTPEHFESVSSQAERLVGSELSYVDVCALFHLFLAQSRTRDGDDVLV